MQLEFESGRKYKKATEKHIMDNVVGEEFTILSQDDDHYMQCAEQKADPREYILEFRDGSAEEHFAAVGPVTLEQVQSAFKKYLRGDRTWHGDFNWEYVELTPSEDVSDDEE